MIMSEKENDAMLTDVLKILGWNGGTIAQALLEIQRLKDVDELNRMREMNRTGT